MGVSPASFGDFAAPTGQDELAGAMARDAQPAHRVGAAGRTEEEWQQPLPYRDLKGNSHETLIWQIALHMVNHATYHRGQIRR